MKILVGISGSVGVLAIPAFLNQFLMQREVEEVRAIMTPTAARFLNPPSLEAPLRSPVRVDPWTDTAPMVSPPELVHGVDVYVIAPASTTTLARCATGSAETLVANCYLACQVPVVFAPAMPVEVQEHPAVRANLGRLQEYGATILPCA